MAANKWATWSEREIQSLLEIWQEDRIQINLSNMKRNRAVYEDMASSLAEEGFVRSYTQIKSKLISLINMYKCIKKEGSDNDKNKDNWPYFDIMDAVLGARDSKAENFVEYELVTYEVNQEDSNSDASNQESMNCNSPPCESQSAMANDYAFKTTHDYAMPASPPKAAPGPTWNKLRKRKRDSDLEDLLEFERKRLEADHKHQLTVVKLLEEFEDRRQERERAHELRMMEMFVNMQKQVLEAFQK